jgi:hypothetical protein
MGRTATPKRVPPKNAGAPQSCAGKKSVAVVLSHAQQAKKDYPDDKFKTDGKKEMDRLSKKSATKLTVYEAYLLNKYFPSQNDRLAPSEESEAAAVTESGEGGGRKEAEDEEEEDEEEEVEEDENDGALCVSSQKDVRAALEDNAEADEDGDSTTPGDDAGEEEEPPSSQITNPRVGRAVPVNNVEVDVAQPAEKRKRSSEVSDKASKKSRVSKEPKVSTPARREVPDPEASDDEESGSRRRTKSTDSKLYKTYVQGKLLPTELRGWFLIAVLARDGPDHKSRSPHRRMNLYTIISLLKNSVKVSDQVYKEFRQAVKECLEIAGERYHIFLMCSALPLLTFISAGFKRMVSSTLSPTA